MNCGIQDAYNVAWKLALVIEGLAPDTLLDSYSIERISADAAAMKLSDKETQRYTFHTDYDVDLRRQQFESMAGDVGMLVTRSRSQRAPSSTTNYRGSPIVEEHPRPFGEHQIQAGDPHPDVVGLRYPDGKDARLFDITRTTTTSCSCWRERMSGDHRAARRHGGRDRRPHAHPDRRLDLPARVPTRQPTRRMARAGAGTRRPSCTSASRPTRRPWS